MSRSRFDVVVIDNEIEDLSDDVSDLDSDVVVIDNEVETLRVHIQRNKGVDVSGIASDLNAAFTGVTGYTGDVTFQDNHTFLSF